MNNVAIIASAGLSRRMNGVNKQFACVLDKPILAYTLEVFEKSEQIDAIIVVIEESNIGFCKEQIIEKFNFTKVINVIKGGKERQDSIYNAILTLSDKTKYIVVHDGARPMVTDKMISFSLKEAEINGAATLGVPVKDTIKEICGSDVVKTLERKKLISVQTPQVFSYKIIKEAYEKAYKDNFYGTDDAMLVERLGVTVKVVEGEYSNIKITTPSDLLLMEIFLKGEKL